MQDRLVLTASVTRNSTQVTTPGLTVVKNVCHLDCPDTCSMQVSVRDGVAVELKGDPDHPFTRGFLCQKMARYLDRVYSPDRLMFPMKRVGAKGEGRFTRISWDEALATISTRFAAIAASPDGPQAILPYSYCGTMGKLQSSSLDRRFFHRLGASKLDRTICATAGTVGYEYTMGRGRLGADPLAVPRCKFIVNWGSNTVNTNSHLWSLMIEARRQNGATIVTVDPYRSPTASRSDWHIAIRPGTDAALALGLMNVIWREGLQDDDYLAKGTVGAGLLRRRVLEEYPPDRVAAITGLDVSTIENFARRLASEQPVADPAQLRNATASWWRHGGSDDRLPAGDHRGLETSRRRGLALDQWHLRLRDGPAHAARPFTTRHPHRQHERVGASPGGELAGPPIRALYVYNSNPAAVTPDQQKVLTGLKRDDLFTVVHDLFATDSVDYADIVLPATSQLEHVDLHGSYGHFEVMYNPRTIDPLGECRSNNDVFRALAGRMGFEADHFPDDLTLIREALDGGPTVQGITLERLQAESSVRLSLRENHSPFAEGIFPTPSGKCELYSERMKSDGLDPLPTYIPPHEDPQTRPELAARHPLQLLSPPRPQFLNSTFANSPKHRAAAGEPTIELADDDARSRGLSDGHWARVFNDRGAFIARVALTGNVRAGVAVATGIYWNKLSPGHSNVNSTTSSALTDMGEGQRFLTTWSRSSGLKPMPRKRVTDDGSR